jgi:hypothetical protein
VQGKTPDVAPTPLPSTEYNARRPIAALLGLLREEGARQPGRRFFIEYVLHAGVNDSDDDHCASPGCCTRSTHK